MYQDLILPTTYTPDLSQSSVYSAVKNETDPNVQKKLLKKLKVLEELIQEKSYSPSNGENLTKKALEEERKKLLNEYQNNLTSSFPKFKHRVEVHKIPLSIKHHNKQELDNSLIKSPKELPKVPECIHYDAPKIGKINATTWKSIPKPSWNMHNKLNSTLNTTSLEILMYEEGHRYFHFSKSEIKENGRLSVQPRIIHKEGFTKSKDSRSEVSSPVGRISQKGNSIEKNFENKIEKSFSKEDQSLDVEENNHQLQKFEKKIKEYEKKFEDYEQMLKEHDVKIKQNMKNTKEFETDKIKFESEPKKKDEKKKNLVSRYCQSDLKIPKSNPFEIPRVSEEVPINSTQATPMPSVPNYSTQPIYIQMPTYNALPNTYPYQYPQGYPAFPSYYSNFYPNYQNTQTYPQHTPNKHEASIQTKEIFNTGIQTLPFPTFSLESSDIEESVSNDIIKQKAWAFNFGSDLSPAELLKKRIKLYKKLKKSDHPHHSIFHETKNEESLIRIRKEFCKPKNQEFVIRAISPRLEQLSTPKHS